MASLEFYQFLRLYDQRQGEPECRQFYFALRKEMTDRLVPDTGALLAKDVEKLPVLVFDTSQDPLISYMILAVHFEVR